MVNERKKVKSEKLNTKDMVAIWSSMIWGDKAIIREKPYPSFSEDEAVFLTKIIFHKPYKFIIASFLDFLNGNYHCGVKLINSADLRRIKFFKAFMETGNAKRAAIQAGYSPKSAKQQGHRTLRWIQTH